MRLALVANPKSGTAPPPERLAELLGADGAQVRVTAIQDLASEDEGGFDRDALAKARATLSEDGPPDRIVVAGGDGSIGLTALIAADMGVPLAIVAAGTANDFARSQGLSLDIEAACKVARDPGAESRHAELALAGDRPFVNAAATGLSVVAAKEASAHKSRLGALAYTVGALRAAVTAKPQHYTVRCDGGDYWEGPAWQVVVGATGAFGGGSEIGGTDPQDGKLDVAVVPAGSRIGLARRAFAMRRGQLTEQADVAHHRGTTIDIEGGSPAFNVDGEVCPCEPAHFTLRPGGFQVVAP